MPDNNNKEGTTTQSLAKAFLGTKVWYWLLSSDHLS